MKKSDAESKEKDDKPGLATQNDPSSSRRRKSSDDEDAKRLARTPSVYRPPLDSASPRTGSHMEGHDYKSKKADDFMPSLVIPGVKFTSPQITSTANLGHLGDPLQHRPTSAEPRNPSTDTKKQRRAITSNENAPKVMEADDDKFHAVTFGPQDTNQDTIKAKITVFSQSKLTDSSKAPVAGVEVPRGSKSVATVEKSIRMTGNGEPQGTATSTVSKPKENKSSSAESLHTKEKIIAVSGKTLPPQVDPLPADPAAKISKRLTEADSQRPERRSTELEKHTHALQKQPPNSQLSSKPEGHSSNKPEERSKQEEVFAKPGIDSSHPEANSVKGKDISIKSKDDFIQTKVGSSKAEKHLSTPKGHSNTLGEHSKGPEPLQTLVFPSSKQPTISQTIRKLPGGRVIIENTKLETGATKPEAGTEPETGTTKPVTGSIKTEIAATIPEKNSLKPQVDIKATEHTLTPEEHSTIRAENLKRPESPPTLVLVSPKKQTTSQTVHRLPGGRVIVENTRLPKTKPIAKHIGSGISVQTYSPADTNKDDVKIQFTIAKPLPKTVPEKLPPQPPPPPPSPPPPPPPRTPPSPLKRIPSPIPPVEIKGKSHSNALIEYLNTISKLTAQELERDEIPSPEFADDNIDVVQLLKKFNIPDQQRALDSLLDTDSVHYDFGGLMRQYYSYVLRSYSPINMQDRYRGVSQPANCFTSVDLSQIGTREEEMEKITTTKLRKLDEKREQLRLVAVDEDHFNYLKNLANEQATLLPLTIVHMLNEQMAPILEDVFRFYGKNLGTEHKSTKEAGFHYMKIRKRCEMYTHICGGSTINEDLSSLYK